MDNRDGEALVKRGRGRPRFREDNSSRFEMRLDREEREMLDHMEHVSGKTKSDLVRRAVLLYYNINYGRW